MIIYFYIINDCCLRHFENEWSRNMYTQKCKEVVCMNSKLGNKELIIAVQITSQLVNC